MQTIITDPDFDPTENPLPQTEFKSKFYNAESFSKSFVNFRKPIFLNLNVQSLNSKHGNLKNFISALANKSVPVDLIAMQELWKIPYPELVDLPGFQRIIFKSRTRGNGGGDGFFIRNGINFNVVEPPFECFINKIFESLTLELCYPLNNTVKKIHITCIYRSPSPVQGMTPAMQHDAFMEKMNPILDFLNSKNHDSFVFLDANINLLEFHGKELANGYFNTIIEKGFYPTNMKASRMQGGSHTLIDHILTNCRMSEVNSGSIIEDISDHFITFLQPNLTKSAFKPSKVMKRQFTTENLNNFKTDLQNLTWQELFVNNDVDVCYDLFWTDFKTLYDLCFPIKTCRFNRNYHKLNNFMTNGLLTSRKNKVNLHKKALLDPSAQNLQIYKTFRNLYNKLVRISKKNSLGDQIQKNVKNPKKPGTF
jgi:hypothetical protein